RSSRRQPPFGIAQIGRSFRNSIATDQLFRTHEFEQMGLAYFVPPGTDAGWHRHWIEQRWNWYVDLGLPEQYLRQVEQDVAPRFGDSRRVRDSELLFDFAQAEWAKLEGLANRNDADMLSHSRATGVDLSCYDQRSGLRWTPYVIS